MQMKRISAALAVAVSLLVGSRAPAETVTMDISSLFPGGGIQFQSGAFTFLGSSSSGYVSHPGFATAPNFAVSSVNYVNAGTQVDVGYLGFISGTFVLGAIQTSGTHQWASVTPGPN